MRWKCTERDTDIVSRETERIFLWTITYISGGPIRFYWRSRVLGIKLGQTFQKRNISLSMYEVPYHIESSPVESGRVTLVLRTRLDPRCYTVLTERTPSLIPDYWLPSHSHWSAFHTHSVHSNKVCPPTQVRFWVFDLQIRCKTHTFCLSHKPRVTQTPSTTPVSFISTGPLRLPLV